MKFLQRIDKTFIGEFVSRKQQIIASTDPNRIFVENIRSFFGISTRLATILCELAVRDGILTKKIGVECPNSDCGRLILSVDDLKQIPETIVCQTCELRENHDYEFHVKSVRTTTFYQLRKKNGTR